MTTCYKNTTFLSMFIQDELETHYVDGKAIRAVKPYEGDLTEEELQNLLTVIKERRYHGKMQTKPIEGGKIHVTWMRSITLTEGK